MVHNGNLSRAGPARRKRVPNSKINGSSSGFPAIDGDEKADEVG